MTPEERAAAVLREHCRAARRMVGEVKWIKGKFSDAYWCRAHSSVIEVYLSGLNTQILDILRECDGFSGQGLLSCESDNYKKLWVYIDEVVLLSHEVLDATRDRQLEPVSRVRSSPRRAQPY